MQWSENFADIPARVLHRCLNRFEPIALASRIAVGVHDEECHRNGHGLGFKKRQDLVLGIEVTGKPEDRDLFLSVPHTLDKIIIGFRARPWPEIRYTGPG
jgi:hypothetical protein